eukprot:Skav221067  [mRNA]  locus=scaffold3118:248345:249521:- [translate_table: standard]
MASQDQVIGLVASECNNFVENFFSENCPTFGGLETPDVMKAEPKAEWFNLYQKFEAEAELTMQNALMLWGLVQAKTFEEQFWRRPCIPRLWMTSCADWLRQLSTSSRPETQWSDEATTGRLAELDQRLAAVEAERNALLVERRALVGRHVHAATSQTLKHQIQLQRYKEEVGMD